MSTRAPLTKVPLMLRLSWISVPSRVGSGGVVARRQHFGDDDVVVGGPADLDGAQASTTGAPLPGRRIFIIDVAMFPSPPGWPPARGGGGGVGAR